MDQAPVFYLLPLASLEPASSASAWLGRIVQNYASPGAEYTPENTSTFITSPLSDTTITDVTTTLKSSSSSEVRARLTSLASISRSSSPSHDVDLNTQSIRFLRLRKHREIFNALKQDPEVQQHLARTLRPGGSPAYMITGLAIWTDADFTKSESTSKATSVDVKAPVTLAVAATTGVVLPSADIEVGGSCTSTARSQINGLSKGSHIFAIEYRAVRRRLRSVLGNSQPILEQYGPRAVSSFVFSGESGAIDRGETDARNQDSKLVLALDDEEVCWADVLEDGPEVEDYEDFSFAFDNV